MRGKPDLLLVWMDLLCFADRDGVVDRHWQAIVDETGLPRERVMAALAQLEGPDSQSRSRNDDGKRIKRIDPEGSGGGRSSTSASTIA